MAAHAWTCVDPSPAAARWRRTDNVQVGVAAGAPGSGDDSTAGYEASSLWIDTSTGALWGCTDAAAGAAVWVQLYPALCLVYEPLTNPSVPDLIFTPAGDVIMVPD